MKKKIKDLFLINFLKFLILLFFFDFVILLLLSLG